MSSTQASSPEGAQVQAALQGAPARLLSVELLHLTQYWEPFLAPAQHTASAAAAVG